MGKTARVMLVTGASGGIGFEIAAQAAEAGLIVAAHGSRSDSAAAAVGRLVARVPEGRFVAVSADYTRSESIYSMVEAAVAEAGRLDAVVDCAVTSPPGVGGPFRALDPAVFAPHAASALGPLQRLCHAAIPYLAQAGGGAIVAFASDSGRFAAPRQSLIGASRAGIIGFVRNLALELAREHIRVNCISPSFVADTPIYDRIAGTGDGRVEKAAARAGLGLPTPKDIAPLALFLGGPGSAKITGQVISVNGGLHA